MNRYVKKRRQTKNGKYKYIYYRISTDGKTRIHSKEYYQHKNKQNGGKQTDAQIRAEKDIKKQEEVAKRIVINDNKKNPANNKIILMKHDKSNSGEAQPVPIFPTVRKVIQVDKNILPLIHTHGLDSLFKREDDIVINGKPYITYRVNGNTINRVKEIAGEDFNTVEFTNRDVNDDLYMWNYSSADLTDMRSPGIGIFDPKGMYPNPLNGRKYSRTYKKIADSNWGLEEKDIKRIELSSGWKNLPFYGYIRELLNMIKTNQVILIRAGTGAGKTVLAPKVALHYLDYGRKGRVLITLPKRLIAAEQAKYAAKTLDVELGNQIGYKYMSSDIDSSYAISSGDSVTVAELKKSSWIDTLGGEMKTETTKMLYATDGSLEQILIRSPTLRNENGDNIWDIIIIDEVHERNSRIDYIMMKMKLALKLNPSLKLILMSATIDSKQYQDYYREFSFAELFVPGTTPKDKIDIWIKPKDDYVTEGIKQIKNILDNEIDENDDEDVSEEEYEKMKMIKELYSELSNQDREDVLKVQEHDPKKQDPNVKWEGKLDKEIEELDDVEKVEILNKKGTILFLVPTLGGENEYRAKKMCDELYKFKDDMFLNTKIFCATLQGKSSEFDKMLATNKDSYKSQPSNRGRVGPWGRKVVIATPVAESSITITGLTYVIDSGFEWGSRYDPEGDRIIMGNQRCSKAQARQRWGRVGRTERGVAIRLYDKSQFESEFPDWPEPNLRKENVVNHIFNVVSYLEQVNSVTEIPSYQYKQIYNLEFIRSLMIGEKSESIYVTPIKENYMLSATNILDFYDFYDGETGNFTLRFYIVKEIYNVLSETFPVWRFGIEHARLIAESFIFNCTDDAIKMIMASLYFKSKKGLQSLFDPKFGLKEFPRMGKNQDKEEYEKICLEIKMKNQEFYDKFEQLWQTQEGRIAIVTGNKQQYEIINKESDQITLLNIHSAYLKQLKKIRTETYEARTYATLTGIVPPSEKDNDTKIREWAINHGLNINELNSIHKEIIKNTYSVVYAFRNILTQQLETIKTTNTNKQVKQNTINFTKDIEELLKETNDLDFKGKFNMWYNSNNNKERYAEEIGEVLGELRILQEDKFDAHVHETINGVIQEIGLSDEPVNKANENTIALDYLFSKGLNLKYRIVDKLLDLFNLEKNENPVLKATIIALRHNIQEREGGLTKENMTLRNIMTYGMYTHYKLSKDGIEIIRPEDPEDPQGKTVMFTTNREKKILSKEQETYIELIKDAERKVKDKEKGCWVVRLWGNPPKKMFENEINYIKWIQAELDYYGKTREARDLKLMRCLFAGYRKNIAQKIDVDNSSPGPDVYKASYKNCFPQKSSNFEILDLSSTSFVDFIPDKKHKHQKDYIIYEDVLAIDVGPVIYTNANFFTIIPRSWLAFGDGKYIPKSPSSECELISE